MERRINKCKAACQEHGYLEGFYNDDNKYLMYKIHRFNNKPIGYYESFNADGILRYKSHFIYDEEIGCEQFYNSQYFYKIPGKKFGEEIKWKEY